MALKSLLEQLGVPKSELTNEERLKRRFSWRNDHTLFHRNCDKSQKKLLCGFHPASPVTIYDKEIWWSDTWNPLEYGREFDFNRPFFDQFAELYKVAPQPNLITVNAENSDYSNYNYANKNCYLCFTGNYLEDSLYCYNAENSANCYDCLFVWNCELCYECTQCEKCYDCKYCLHSKNCSESMFLEDCIGCKNCFMCSNLTQAEYHFLNKKYSPQEYNKIIEDFNLHTRSGLSKAKEFWLEQKKNLPHKENHNLEAENCTGEYILYSKNCKNCYIMSPGCEDCENIFNGFPKLKDASDSIYCGENGELIYESIASGENSQKLFFCNLVFTNCYEIFYSNLVINSKNCYGCCSLRNNDHCILNKKYNKEDYEELIPKIIDHMKNTGEWGQFFPANLSPYAYNETIAQDFFPLNEEEAIKQGFNWRKPDISEYQPQTFTVPDSINETDENILNSILACKKTGKNFKIIPEELKVYKKMQIPIPELCPAERHNSRLKTQPPVSIA